jgi:hypothetical protein
MHALKPQSAGVATPIALVLFFCGLALAWHAVSLIIGEQTFTGIKFGGLSIIVFHEEIENMTEEQPKSFLESEIAIQSQFL